MVRRSYSLETMPQTRSGIFDMPRMLEGEAENLIVVLHFVLQSLYLAPSCTASYSEYLPEK